MKQLNWYQIFGNTHKIPDGSTVTPTDDVQILLNCANIWDKAYTTISELLADTTSLGAVIIDNNAVNYLVRSTTWASSVTADATAMTYIGQNNYCANTLLADATWSEAICNSTYWQSVINASVPTMTSNTTPSGTITFSSENASEDRKGYYAFDKNSSKYWESYSSPGWIQYEFPNPILLKKWQVTPMYGGSGSNTTLKDYVLEGSIDGENYETIETGQIPNTPGSKPTYTKNQFGNTTKYKYFRFTNTGTWGAVRVRCVELQYIGREDV